MRSPQVSVRNNRWERKKLSVVRRLTLLRHAKSDWNNKLDDHDRPLNDRGRRSAPLMGRYIEKNSIPIDVILASTAERVQQTLKLLTQTWKSVSPQIFSSQNLYLASPGQIVEELSNLDPQWHSVLVIGHNPGIGQLASWLADEPLDFPTACLASFELSVDKWQHISVESICPAKKTHFSCPRELE